MKKDKTSFCFGGYFETITFIDCGKKWYKE